MKTSPIKITHIVSKEFNGLKVSLQISDTKNGLYFRLVCDEFKTDWSEHYSGILTLKVKDRTFIALSAYWGTSILKCEQPIELIYGKDL